MLHTFGFNFFSGNFFIFTGRLHPARPTPQGLSGAPTIPFICFCSPFPSTSSVHGAINSASTREVYNADKKTLVQGSEVIKPANVLPAPAGISSSRRDI